MTIVTNDGKGTQETMLQAAVGCNAKVRYHEARADFSIESSSRARVVVEGTQLKVQMREQHSCIVVQRGSDGVVVDSSGR